MEQRDFILIFVSLAMLILVISIKVDTKNMVTPQVPKTEVVLDTARVDSLEKEIVRRDQQLRNTRYKLRSAKDELVFRTRQYERVDSILNSR